MQKHERLCALLGDAMALHHTVEEITYRAFEREAEDDKTLWHTRDMLRTVAAIHGLAHGVAYQAEVLMNRLWLELKEEKFR